MELIFILVVLYTLFKGVAKKLGKGGEDAAQAQGAPERSTQEERLERQHADRYGMPPELRIKKPMGEGEGGPSMGAEMPRGYQPIQMRMQQMVATDKPYDYKGSLGADSHEGEDVCDPTLEHQRKPKLTVNTLRAAASEQPEPQWDEQTLIQGVVMSEILKRPSERKWGRF